MTSWTPWEISRLLGAPAESRAGIRHASEAFAEQMAYTDMRYFLPDDILVKVDRTTMAHSLESRAPFLDHRIIELAAALPVEWKLKGLRKKHLLKESQRGTLPAAVIERQKQGFNAPVSSWFHRAGALGELARAATTDEVLSEWFDRAEIDTLWRRHDDRREDNGLKIFGLTCLALWLRQSA